MYPRIISLTSRFTVMHAPEGNAGIEDLAAMLEDAAHQIRNGTMASHGPEGGWDIADNKDTFGEAKESHNRDIKKATIEIQPEMTPIYADAAKDMGVLIEFTGEKHDGDDAAVRHQYNIYGTPNHLFDFGMAVGERLKKAVGEPR